MPVLKVRQAPANATVVNRALWKSARVQVVINDRGDDPRQVGALVFGSVAVHRAMHRPMELWSVTHAGCGMALCHLKTEEDALRVGTYLQEQYTLWLRCSDIPSARSKAPESLKAWLKKVNTTNEWSEP